MKKLLVLFIAVGTCTILHAQPGAGFVPGYTFLSGGNLTADKNFYLLTVLGKNKTAEKIISTDKRLKVIEQERWQLLLAHVDDTCRTAASLLNGFLYTAEEQAQIALILDTIYRQQQPVIDNLINKQLRPGGFYQRFTAFSNDVFWKKAWAQYFTGINYIIEQFGMGKKMRYPRIDSSSYDVNSRYYCTALKVMFAFLSEKKNEIPCFYVPSLNIAMQLMDMNDRDEPARHEPLALHDNKLAVQKIKQTQFSKYTYAAILIPGNGPELFTTPISPINKMHCDIGADRFKQGLAPFIIVSGGYCYPFRGPYCEAIEMKKYLVNKHKIPASVIIIEPQARHTTTNFRNANRLLYRYDMPVNKPLLCTTTKEQTDYIMTAGEKGFDQRNLNELGYLPYRDKKRTGLHDIVFYPTPECLHMDPADPLDP